MRDHSDLYKWWNGLDDRRGDRAALRQAVSLDDVRKTNAFGFAPLKTWDGGLAVAGLLAHVRGVTNAEADEYEAVGRYLATAGGDGLEGINERRFRRLLAAPDHEALLGQLRRVLPQVGYTVPFAPFAESVYRWDERVRRAWARGFYSALYRTQSEVEGGPPEGEHEWQRIGRAAQTWHTALLGEHGGERSELERCGGDLHAVQLAPGYHRLRAYARAGDLDELKHAWQLAAVAAVLAHVRTPLSAEAVQARGRYGISFGEIAASGDGSPAKGLARMEQIRQGKPASELKPQDDARLREARFRRLLAAEERADLTAPLIRALHQTNREADVARLAADLFLWGKAVRQRWAADYYQIANPE